VARLRGIVRALSEIAAETPVVMPLHPRTRKLLPSVDVHLPNALHVVDPLSYVQMVAAEGSAALVVTDSGGVQKEAFWLGVPCVTARDETEWVVTLADNRNIVAGADRADLVEASRRQLRRGRAQAPAVERASAASTIVERLLQDSRTG